MEFDPSKWLDPKKFRRMVRANKPFAWQRPEPLDEKTKQQMMLPVFLCMVAGICGIVAGMIIIPTNPLVTLLSVISGGTCFGISLRLLQTNRDHERWSKADQEAWDTYEQRRDAALQICHWPPPTPLSASVLENAKYGPMYISMQDQMAAQIREMNRYMDKARAEWKREQEGDEWKGV